MIHDKLPSLHQPLADLIRTIAPDAKVELSTTIDDTVHVWCNFKDGGSATFKHNSDGYWTSGGEVLETELHLLERLCRASCAPRLAGPADVAELQAKARDREHVALYDQCCAALSRMDSAAILACSRALPNNDWRRHGP